LILICGTKTGSNQNRKSSGRTLAASLNSIPTPLSILVRDSLRCSVKGVVHIIVRDLQFLDNVLHGIAFISENKNRLTSFRRKLFVPGHFEPVIKPANADALDTQLVERKASFIAYLIRTTVFSCANIIAKWFSNDQLAF
jgi:hypothetical protein